MQITGNFKTISIGKDNKYKTRTNFIVRKSIFIDTAIGKFYVECPIIKISGRFSKEGYSVLEKEAFEVLQIKFIGPIKID